MRLGFVLDRGVTFSEAKKWLIGLQGLDTCTLRPIQITYTAAPIFGGGLTDPLLERLGVLAGERELVAVPLINIDRSYQREGSTSYGPAQSAEGLGLLESPRLDAELKKLAEAKGEAGSVRSRLMQCAFGYAHDAGRDRVDVEALAEALAEEGERYRSAEEIAAYDLKGVIFWCLERVPPGPPRKPYYPEQGLPAEEASARLKDEVAKFIDEAVARGASIAVSAEADPAVAEPPPVPVPVLGIKGGAGLGKTATVIALLAALPGAALLNIEVYVPDNKLGETVAERWREEWTKQCPTFNGIDLNPQLRVQVMYGRTATLPYGTPVCARGDLARDFGAAGIPGAEPPLPEGEEGRRRLGKLPVPGGLPVVRPVRGRWPGGTGVRPLDDVHGPSPPPSPA